MPSVRPPETREARAVTSEIRDKPERDPVEEACGLNDAAVEAFHAGRAEKAEGLFRRALRLLE